MSVSRRVLVAPLFALLLLGACGSEGGSTNAEADKDTKAAKLLTEDELTEALLTEEDLPKELSSLIEIEPTTDDSEIEVTGDKTCQKLIDGEFGDQPDVAVESELEDPETLATVSSYVEGFEGGYSTLEKEYKRLVEDCAEFGSVDEDGFEVDFTVTGEGSIDLGDEGFSLLIELSQDGAKIGEIHERVVLVGDYLTTVDYLIFEPTDTDVVDEVIETAVAKVEDVVGK